MKPYVSKGLLIAGLAIFSFSSFAQDKLDKADKADKADKKERKDVQQIIITRSGDMDEKTTIEINGDKVTVNGKEADNNGDVKVRVSKIRDLNALRNFGSAGSSMNTDVFNGNRGMSLFSEDANRAMLGVMTQKDEKGARINAISEGSAAAKAGLKENDIITKIDGELITETDDVAKAIRKHKPGEKTVLTILRNGKEQKITAELEKWKGIQMNPENFRTIMPDIWNNVPNPSTPPRITINGMPAPRLGMSVQDTEDGKGVKVLEVEDDSNAEKAGIKENDIITQIDNEVVNTTDEVARKVRAGREKSSINLKVLRNGKAQNIEVKIPRRLKTADL